MLRLLSKVVAKVFPLVASQSGTSSKLTGIFTSLPTDRLSLASISISSTFMPRSKLSPNKSNLPFTPKFIPRLSPTSSVSIPLMSEDVKSMTIAVSSSLIACVKYDIKSFICNPSPIVGTSPSVATSPPAVETD